MYLILKCNNSDITATKPPSQLKARIRLPKHKIWKYNFHKTIPIPASEKAAILAAPEPPAVEAIEMPHKPA